jgi:hypothetical protein
MVNLNRYKPGNFPGGPLYAEWREVNAEMIQPNKRAVRVRRGVLPPQHPETLALAD